MRRTLMALGCGFALACSAPAPLTPSAAPAPAPAPTVPARVAPALGAAEPIAVQSAPTALVVPAAPANASQWRARGDELARGGDNAAAAKAYDACALAAGSDMESSLYCQTAVAVLKKMRARDGG